jgi:hypothetical protein
VVVGEPSMPVIQQFINGKLVVLDDQAVAELTDAPGYEDYGESDDDDDDGGRRRPAPKMSKSQVKNALTSKALAGAGLKPSALTQSGAKRACALYFKKGLAPALDLLQDLDEECKLEALLACRLDGAPGGILGSLDAPGVYLNTKSRVIFHGTHPPCLRCLRPLACAVP